MLHRTDTDAGNSLAGFPEMSSSPLGHQHDVLLAGRYLIQERLGSGSIGTVYLAEDQKAGEPVALKLIRTDRLTSKAIEHLQDEFRTFASLRHPQIARAYDFGYVEGGRVPFYTREYIPGTPLSAGPPRDASPKRVLRPFLDLLEALRYLHDHGILHLDIHAGNLIVAEDDSRGAVLIDFGLPGRAESSTRSTTRANDFEMPPELLAGDDPGPTTDLYMVGRLLLYRLTGRTDSEVRLPAEIPGWGRRLTLEVERVVAKALQPALNGRFPSATAFRDVLSRLIGEPIGDGSGPDSVESIVGRKRELSQVDACLTDVGRGTSGVFWIEGPTGFGKTRLLREARVRAQLRGVPAVTVSFVSSPVPETDLADELRTSKVLPGSELRWLRPLDTEHGASPRQRARRAAETFFAEEGSSLVLLLDDYDHVDGPSRLLIEALVRECVASERSDSSRALLLVGASTRAPSFMPRTAVRRLRPLSIADSEDLLTCALSPTSASRTFLRHAARCGLRSPRRLRQLARSLRSEWGASGRIPASADVPDLAETSSPVALPTWVVEDAISNRLLFVLAVAHRPLSLVEIASATQHDTSSIRRALERLENSELVVSTRRGRRRWWRIHPQDMASTILESSSERERKSVHRALARHLANVPSDDPHEQARLARHYLSAGSRSQGARLALVAADELRTRGEPSRAIELLEVVRSVGIDPSHRYRLTKVLCALLEETGDNLRGVELLEPYYLDLPEDLSDERRVHLYRLLGTHCHRAGLTEKALRVFSSLRRLADETRDVEDLILVDCELAELHTYQGDYELAEEACRRGLSRLDDLASSKHDAISMELRASLGHLELRRMNLTLARDELSDRLRVGGARRKRRDSGRYSEQSRHRGEAVESFFQRSAVLPAGGEIASPGR